MVVVRLFVVVFCCCLVIVVVSLLFGRCCCCLFVCLLWLLFCCFVVGAVVVLLLVLSLSVLLFCCWSCCSCYYCCSCCCCFLLLFCCCCLFCCCLVAPEHLKKKQQTEKNSFQCFCCLPFSLSHYHPPENFRSQDKNISGINFLMQVQFLEFSYLFFMQVQVWVLPEINFKQVVMQVPFSSIPVFWGTPLGLSHCREDSVGIFAGANRGHWVGAIWVVPKEVLRT